MPIDRDDIKSHRKQSPKEYSLALFLSRYQPTFEQTDIETAEFPESPDIITASNVLFWTRDPMKVFANAAKQANIGATLCFNRIDFMSSYFSQFGTSYEVFRGIRKVHGTIPGFRFLYPSYEDQNTSMLS